MTPEGETSPTASRLPWRIEREGTEPSRSPAESISCLPFWLIRLGAAIPSLAVERRTDRPAGPLLRGRQDENVERPIRTESLDEEGGAVADRRLRRWSILDANAECDRDLHG